MHTGVYAAAAGILWLAELTRLWSQRLHMQALSPGAAEAVLFTMDGATLGTLPKPRGAAQAGCHLHVVAR